MRLLLISKFFLPATSAQAIAQAIQSTKVASALAQQGVDVHVLAGLDADTSGPPSCASSRVHYIPYRTAYEPRVLARGLRRTWTAAAYMVLTTTSWARAAVRMARDVIVEHQPDAILTISGPADSHFAGLILRRVHQIPWVASFSDPWPPKICPAPYNKKGCLLQEWKDYRTLRRVLDSCDAIHMPSTYALQLAVRHSTGRILEKAVAIPHIGSSKSPSPIEMKGYLLHIGELGWRRAIPSLPTAVKHAVDEPRGRFRGLVCIGSVCSEFARLVSEAGAEDYIVVRAPVDPERAAALAAGASALLVIEAAMEYSPYLPSKFADYAATGRPIIAITPPRSAIRDYLARFGGGLAVGHTHDEIVWAIRSVFSDNITASAPAHRGNSLSDVFSAEAVGTAYRSLITRAIFTCNGA